MAMVRNIAAGGTYIPAPGEHLVQLQNTGDVPLYVGIRNGEYLIAAAAGVPMVTYVLTEEQWVRLQQQLTLQPIYKTWTSSGLLTVAEVDEVPPAEPPPPPPPPPDPDPECEPEESAT